MTLSQKTKKTGSQTDSLGRFPSKGAKNVEKRDDEQQGTKNLSSVTQRIELICLSGDPKASGQSSRNNKTLDSDVFT